jgi:cell wall-associated NlpC family hydrolase
MRHVLSRGWIHALTLAHVTASLLVLSSPAVALTATPAQSASASSEYSAAGATQPSTPSIGRAALRLAARQQGKPYRYGAAGPASFDCSGLTMYVYGKLGVSLPHNAQQQYAAIPHVSRLAMRAGDLVFVRQHGTITHVGIYAGEHRWWVAPHSGTVVTKQRIYTSHIVVGRPS